MKRCKRLCAVLLLLILLCGCAGQRVEYINPIRFYYCSADASFNQPGGTLASETRELRNTQISIDEILRLYFAGPQSDTLVSPFPAGIAFSDVRIQDGMLTLRLSEQYAQLSGAARTEAAACLTLTFTQVRTIERVCIETDDGVNEEQRQATYSAADFVLRDTSVTNPEWTATLYFWSPSSRQVRTEKRTVAYQTQDELPRLVLEQLLAGPTIQNLTNAVPQCTQCVDLSLSGGVCSVVLSQEFAACDTDVQTAQLAVRTLAATLCALPEVQSVQLSVIGTEDLAYCSIREALTPADNWFT